MWTTLITVIQKEHRDTELHSFLASVRKAGICVVELKPENGCGLPEKGNLRQPFAEGDWHAAEGQSVPAWSSREVLVLTDIRQVADSAKEEEMALLMLEWADSAPAYGVPYVAQGLEEVDIEYLDMVYRRFHDEPIVIAQTERLCIRELACEEAETFFRLAGEAGFALADAPEKEAGQLEQEFFRAYRKGQYELHGYGIWAVTDKRSGELLGIAGVEDREQQGESYLELGYALEKKWRGQGITKEAAFAILHFLKERLQMQGKIKCLVPKGNIASQRIAQGIGMLQTKDIFDEFYTYERIL